MDQIGGYEMTKPNPKLGVRAAQPDRNAMSEYRAKRKDVQAANDAPAHWMKPETLAGLPKVQNDFSGNAVNPANNRGSKMVKKDKPHPAPRPAPGLAMGADRAAFNARWNEERKAAYRALRKDRAGLVQAKTKLETLHSNLGVNPKTMSAAQLSDAQQEYYRLRRKAKAIQGQTQKHTHKFNRRLN